MTKKKVEPIIEDPIEVEEIPQTRQVRVSSVTRREFIDEEPVAATVEEETYLDPFSAFNEIVTTNQQATLRIWRLPNYEADGRTAISGTEREYCGSISYSADNAALLDQIHARVPMGGMLSLELFADGAIRKRGLLKLVKPLAAPQQIPGYPHVTIQNPATAQPAVAPIDPMVAMERQAESFLKVAQVIKQLQPDHASTPTSNEPASLKDQILEKVIVHAFTGEKVPEDRFDKVISALGGGPPEPGVWQTVVEHAAPHLPSMFSQIAPGLNALLLRLSGAPAPVAQTVSATSSGVQTASEAQQGALPEAPAIDPAERAWRRVLNRLLDDLFYHVQLLNEGANGVDVSSSAEAIYDLLGRFESHVTIQQTVGALLTGTPEQVIDLCVLMLPGEIAPRVASLKEQPAALAWLSELQERAKEIIAESEQAGELVDTEENENNPEPLKA